MTAPLSFSIDVSARWPIGLPSQFGARSGFYSAGPRSRSEFVGQSRSPRALTRGKRIIRVFLVRRATPVVSFVVLLALAVPCVCQAAQIMAPGPSACHGATAGQASEARLTPSPESLCCCGASDQAASFRVAAHRALPDVVAGGTAVPATAPAEPSVESVRRFTYHLHDPPATSVLVLRL